MPHKLDCACPACSYRRGEGKGQAPHLSVRLAADVKARILGATGGARAYLERLVRGESSAVLREQELLSKISRLEGQIDHLQGRLREFTGGPRPLSRKGTPVAKNSLYSVMVKELPSGLIALKGWSKITRVRAFSEAEAFQLGFAKLLGKRCLFHLEVQDGPGQFRGMASPLKDHPEGARVRVDVEFVR